MKSVNLNEQWYKEAKEFNDIANSIGNSFKESKNNNVIQEKSNDNILVSKRNYEQLRWFETETLKIKRSGLALIVNNGTFLPVLHSDYNNNGIKIEIYDIDNHSIEIEVTKYIVKIQILFNKIKAFIAENLDLLMNVQREELIVSWIIIFMMVEKAIV